MFCIPAPTFATPARTPMRRMARAWLMRLLATPLLVAGSALAAGIDCLPGAVPGYAQPKPDSRDSVVVFLHGLHGDARSTWTTSNWVFANTAWPCLLLAESDRFPDTKAYLASYRSVMAGLNPGIQQIARELVADLVKDDVFKHASVTFVAHSMGGIVLARILTDRGLLSANERARIRLVLFAGTPAQPTEAAAICAKWGINATQCSELSDGSEMQKLWQRWDALPKAERPPVWCVAEGGDMRFASMFPLGRIVPEASAHRPCNAGGRTQVAIGFDHSQLVKPESAASRPHGFLQAAFGGCVRPHLRRTSLADEEEPFARPVRGWLDSLVSQLKLPDADRRVAVAGVLAAGTSRYFFPQGGRDTLDPAQYARLPAAQFADDLNQALRPVLLQDRIDWARPIDRVASRLPDGEIERLIAALRSRGDLQQGDQLVALPVWDSQPDVLWLLAVRPGPAGPGLLGVLALPVPKTCPA